MKLETSSRKRPSSLNAAAAEIAAAVFLHVSFWLLWTSMTRFRMTPVTIALTAILPVVLYLLSRIHGFGKLLPVYTAAIPLAAFFVRFRYFTDGFRELFNYFAKAFNEVHGLKVFPYGDGYPGELTGSSAAQWALLLIAFLTAGLFAYAICRKVKWLALPLTVLPPLAGFAAGLLPTKPAFVFYLVAATFYLILLSTRSRGTARRLTWLNGEISAALLVFLMLLCLLIPSDFRSEPIEHLREQISQKITAFRYEPEEQADGMPGGDLNSAGAVAYDGQTVLTVETPEPFVMYLKGLNGDRLEDGIWTGLKDDAVMKEYSLVRPWVHAREFSPNYSYGKLLDLKDAALRITSPENSRTGFPKYHLSVHNERAFSDRIFYPYEMSSSSNVLHHINDTLNGLTSEGLRGQRNYELETYKPMTTAKAGDYGSISAKSLLGEEWQALEQAVAAGDEEATALYLRYEEFQEAETAYRSFAKQNYSGSENIPEEYRDVTSQIAAALFGTSPKQTDAVYRVRNYFSKNFTYSLDADNTTQNGADPLLTFATETRTGYDAHFASLAVLLFREAGIPARYAEGYYVSEDILKAYENQKGTEEEPLSIDIPDSASHAWVELYKNGVGWVPVEVTPGYYETDSGSSSAETSSREETVQPEETPEPDPAGETDDDNGAGDEQDEQTEPEQNSGNFKWLLIPLLLLLLMGPLAYLRVRRSEIARADGPEAITKAYRYMIKTLKRVGIPVTSGDPLKAAPFLGDYETAYREAVALFLKSRFSAEGLSPEECRSVCGFVLDLTGNMNVLRKARKQVKEKEKHHGK